MNAKITKLEEQYEADCGKLENSEKLSDIFRGVSIFVNGYTEPSADELRLIMLLHGGIYHHYHRTDKTTHVIASNLPNAKMNQLKSFKVVKPEWIVESVAAGKLLDYKNYLLFANPSAFQAELNFKKEDTSKNQGLPILLVFLKMSIFIFNFILSESPSKTPKGIAKTAVDEKFLSEFYSNSRLHHLSTMKAMFKQYVDELREKHDGTFIGRKRILEWKQKNPDIETEEIPQEKVIMHIDMDCFFASVALRNHPELVGQPIAVTHAKGNPTHQREGVNRKFEYNFYRKKMEAKIGKESDSSEDEDDPVWLKEVNSMSEIASCSYEARKAGVRNGMYLGSALKLCPNLKTVPYDFEGYTEVSYALYHTVAEYTLDIEAVSIDELFIDLDALLSDIKMKPLDFATFLRKEIREKTGCPSSTGLGANKLQARLATKRAKPDGQFHLTSSLLEEFMMDVDIYDLPGVGRTLGYKLKAWNVKTCQDLQNISLEKLKKEFGAKTGETLYKSARGIDDRNVTSSHQRKSVSAEVNYGIRFKNNEEALEFFKRLSGEVSNRLKEIKMKGKNISFKVMTRAKDAPVETAKFLGHGACDYVTRSASLTIATDDPEVISKHVINIYKQLNLEPSDLRGIGIQITKLEESNNKKNVGTIENFLKAKSKAEPSTSNQKVETKFVEKLDLPNASQIDLEVLKCLPDEIRLEILNEYGISPEEKEVVKTEISQNKESPWSKLSLREVRTMIKEWVGSVQKPEAFDIGMLANYLTELVKKRNLENVDIILKCLHRHISEVRAGDENWTIAYKNIVNDVQNSMLKFFGKSLVVQEF